MGKLSRIGKEDAGEERVGVGQERGKDLLGFQVECTPIVSTAVQRLEGNDEEAELQLQDPRTFLPPPPVHNSGRATSPRAGHKGTPLHQQGVLQDDGRDRE